MPLLLQFKTNWSERRVSIRQSLIQLGMASDTSAFSITASTRTPVIASQGNFFRPSSSQIAGLQIPTTTSLQETLVGGNWTAKVTAILGPLSISPDYTITDAFQANLSTTAQSLYLIHIKVGGWISYGAGTIME